MPGRVRLYNEAVDIYEKAHYSKGEDEKEVRDILSWFHKPGARVLDLGCGTGLHALRLAGHGHRVVGLDKSDRAIEIARYRAEGLDGVRFEVSDLEGDGFVAYGPQDLVLSLGNTLSHISRSRLVTLFGNIRRVLAPGGVLVFNVLYWAHPFQRNVVERDPDGEINIVWERELIEDKGTILLRGHFLKESFTEILEAHCYKVPEMLNLLELAGFSNIRWSNRLDFRGRASAGVNTVYFRAVMPKTGAFRQAS